MGDAIFDFGQCFCFNSLGDPISHEPDFLEHSRVKTEIPRRGHDSPLSLPCGCCYLFLSFLKPVVIWKFVFLSTWGDPFYLGLNGLEMYDWQGSKLPISINS